jgi:hypothetical protein
MTEEQEKGLDIMVKLLRKKYPYIIGVSPNIEDLQSYSSLLTLKIIVSRNKIEEYFKLKSDNFWDEFWRLSNIFYTDPDPEELIIKDIKKLCSMFYDSITDEYQFKTEGLTKQFRTVKINSFIFDDSN